MFVLLLCQLAEATPTQVAVSIWGQVYACYGTLFGFGVLRVAKSSFSKTEHTDSYWLLKSRTKKQKLKPEVLEKPKHNGDA